MKDRCYFEASVVVFISGIFAVRHHVIEEILELGGLELKVFVAESGSDCVAIMKRCTEWQQAGEIKSNSELLAK